MITCPYCANSDRTMISLVQNGTGQFMLCEVCSRIFHADYTLIKKEKEDDQQTSTKTDKGGAV